MSLDTDDLIAQTDAELIAELNKNYSSTTIKKGKVKKSEFKLFLSDIKLTSWKFNEWDYGKPSRIQLPTQARGLFTMDDKIVIRGYDKFFNVDELPSTKWDFLLQNTVGPFELTSKENGCIIFISGLANGELVVCSKHSTGYRDDSSKNHALYGFNKVREQLDSLGIAHSELARTLYAQNLTAVMELCDDDFEEHVLRYTREETGLYLHGLNHNTPTFQTLPMSEVHAFADKFGFKKIDYFTENDPHKLKAFLEDCGKYGSYRGKELEGFVVRCKLKDNNCDYFFKYKFEEPYLMYRQWREVTKELIAGKAVSELRISKHRLQTLDYIEFIAPILRSDEHLRQEYAAGHGIIELRERYLKHAGKRGFELAADEGGDMIDIGQRLKTLDIDKACSSGKKVKYVIVPVATIGCGKTTTAVALKYLFPEWSHIQNDDIPNPVKDKLVKGALDLLQSSPCCIIDRNNHQKRERKQIFADFDKFFHDYIYSSEYNLKFICLNFIKDKYQIRDKLWSVTQDRVLRRGDNHQSIKPGKDGADKVEWIMQGFINRFQKVEESKEPDSRFNLIIDLTLSGVDSSLENITQIVRILNSSYPDLVPTIPSDAQILESFHYALSHKTTIQKIVKDLPNKRQKKQFKPSYFSISLKNPDSLLLAVEGLLLVSGNEQIKVMYQSLKQLGRIQSEFHVTLTHIATLRTNREVYSNFTKKYFAKEIEEMSKDETLEKVSLPFGACSIKLKRLCCTRDLMCIEVVLSLSLPNQEPLDKVCSNKYPHFTLGTVNEKIPAKDSNIVLENINDFGYAEQNGHFEMNWEDEVVFKDEELELLVHR